MNEDKDLILPELIFKTLGVSVLGLIDRFVTSGWRHQGKTEIGCYDCETEYHVFRKPYSTTKGEYEYWAIVCIGCKSCEGLDSMDTTTQKIFREWSQNIDKNAKEVPTRNRKERELAAFRSGLTFQPTEEQLAVIDAAKQGDDLSIEALAGTGKTSTLKLLAESQSSKSGVYVAFNRSIVDEAKSTFPSSVMCSTAHGLAFRAVGRNYAARLKSDQRLSFKQVAEWLGAPKFAFKSSISDHILDPAQVARYAQATVRNFCKSIDDEILKKHVEMPILVSSNIHARTDFVEKILPLAKKIWFDLLQYQGFMRFGHDYYLKMWQLGKPSIPSDFILFDEAQDADPVMLDVVNAQNSSQIVYCGDQFQAIYEWRGARNALTMVNVDEHLWLTQSFRFGSKIAEEANNFLARLQSPKYVRGFGQIKSSIAPCVSPDAILCRTNAGVIAALMAEQYRHRKVAIIGRTQDLIDFAEACGQLMQGERTGHPELAPFSTWESVVGFIEEFPEEAQEIKSMVELVESFGSQKLVVALRNVVEERFADVTISTAHRAKGREWNEVRLHGDFLHVNDMDTEDLRLAYVAVTRAKVTLDMTAWDAIVPLEERNEAIASMVPVRNKRPPLRIGSEELGQPERGLRSRFRNRES
jgi:superfamily I DNA/RNA helicase